MQVNSLVEEICDDKNVTSKFEESSLVSCANIPAVQILSSTDEDIGRHEYKGDIYSEENDGIATHLTIEPHQPESINKLSTEDLTYYIDTNCITANKTILKHFRNAKSRKINTVDVTLQECRIEGEGYMDLKTVNGEWLTTKMLYVPNATGTIISPTFIAMENSNFTSWHQMSHTDTGHAKIMFFHRQEL